MFAPSRLTTLETFDAVLPPPHLLHEGRGGSILSIHCETIDMKKLTALAFVAASISTTAAQAHITCNGSFQVVNGREISTPYCRDEKLATVARARGVDVTANQIRNDASKKASVCRLLGQLNSVSSACTLTE